MKKYLALVVLGLLVVPAVAFAAVMANDDVIPKDRVIEGNYYLASKNPTVLGTINGDLIVFGGNVTVSGDIKNDLFVAGGTVVVNGNIGDDVRAFGGTVTLNGNVGGEAIVMGGNVIIGPSAVVGKDLTLGSGNPSVNVAAKVSGKTIILRDNAAGKEKSRGFVNNVMSGAWWYGQIIGLLGMLLFGLVLYSLLPKYMKKEAKYGANPKNFWKSLGLGFVALIVVPIAAIICFVTQIGVMIGFVLVFAYIVLIMVSVVFAGFIFANIVLGLIKKNGKAEIGLPCAMGGIVVLHLLTLVPFVGWLIGLVFFLLSMGTLITCKYMFFKEAK